MTAINVTYSFAHALLWRQLGVDHPHRVVQLALVDDQSHVLPVPSFLFGAIGASGWFHGQCAFVTPQTPVRIDSGIRSRAVLALTSECFSTLGVTAVTGRLFSAADEHGRGPVALITHLAWQRDFNARPDVLGASITFDGLTYTVIGVTERRFDGLVLGFPAQVIVPLDTYRAATGGGVTYRANVFARLAASTDLQAVRTSLPVASREWLNKLPHDLPPRQRQALKAVRLEARAVAGGIDYVLRDRFRQPILVLLAPGMLLAVVSLSNVAQLVIAILVSRKQELLTRLALGSGRGRAVAAVAGEATIVATIGAVLGVGIAIGLTRFLMDRLGGLYPGLEISGPPLTFRIVAALIAFAVAVLPAAAGALVHSHAVTLTPLLSGRGGATIGTSWSRKLLVSAAVLLATVLVTVNLLALRILLQRTGASTGIRIHGVIASQLVPLPDKPWQSPSGSYATALLDRVKAIPGVESAALARSGLFLARPYFDQVNADGRDAAGMSAEQHVVTESFFVTLNVPLVEGRLFTREDDHSRAPVAVISESLARRLFPDGKVLGRQVRIAQYPDALTVIGVVRDVALLDPKKGAAAALYRSFWQLSPQDQVSADLSVHLANRPLVTVAPAIRRAVEDGGLEFASRVEALEDRLDRLYLEERLVVWLSTGFSTVGLVVTMIGIYTLVAHAVNQRRREIGVRVALGAQPAAIRRLVFTDAAKLLAPGWIAGWLFATAAYQLTSRLLNDERIGGTVALIAMAALLVAATAVLATVGPVNAAVRIEPRETMSEA